MGRYFFLNDVKLAIAPGCRVIKAAEYARIIEAEGLVAEAQARAKAIVASAERRAADRERLGYSEGHRRGKDAISKYMMGVISKSRDYLQENEDRVVALVIATLKKILGDMDDRDMVVNMVRSAMAVVSRQNQVVVLVSPDRVELVEKHMKQILQPYPGIKSVEVVGDPKVMPANCILETKMGRVEASLDSQLDAINSALSDLGPDRKERLEKNLKAIELGLSAGLVGG